MGLRDILNRLTEEELELLRDEIEGDLYEEIERVIDDKQQPSIFAQQYNVGDVFLTINLRGRKVIHKIISHNNPSFTTQFLLSTGLNVDYCGLSALKAADMMDWKKVDAKVWDKAKSCYDNMQDSKKKVEMKFSQDFENLFDEYWEG